MSLSSVFCSILCMHKKTQDKSEMLSDPPSEASGASQPSRESLRQMQAAPTTNRQFHASDLYRLIGHAAYEARVLDVIRKFGRQRFSATLVVHGRAVLAGEISRCRKHHDPRAAFAGTRKSKFETQVGLPVGTKNKTLVKLIATRVTGGEGGI